MNITNRESAVGTVVIRDQDGQPFAAIPAGITVTAVSADPTIAPVTVVDGTITIASGIDGNTEVTVTVDGLPGGPAVEVIPVSVVNSAPAGFSVEFATVAE